MSAQIPYIHRVVEALNIPVVKQAGYEADDLIGTLAHQAERAGCDVVIVTGDKDMLQLVTPHVRIYDPVKDKWSGEAECVAQFGGEPARVIEIMGLMGDATDNIPGVKGIGEKTAMKLIAQFGTIDELLRRTDEVTPPRIKAMLVEQADNARLSRKLATIDIHSPIAFDAEAFHVKPPHQDQLIELLRELEFTLEGFAAYIYKRGGHTMKHLIPETSPDYDHTRIIERPDGFYWTDADTGEEYGPFPSLLEAVQDMEYNAESD